MLLFCWHQDPFWRETGEKGKKVIECWFSDKINYLVYWDAHYSNNSRWDNFVFYS